MMQEVELDLQIMCQKIKADEFWGRLEGPNLSSYPSVKILV